MAQSVPLLRSHDGWEALIGPCQLVGGLATALAALASIDGDDEGVSETQS
jgi:hypothetical protein